MGLWQKLVFILLIAFISNTGALEQPVQIVTEDFAPYQILQKDGSIGGFATQRVRALFDDVGVPYRIDVNDWTISYRLALSTANVCIYSMARTKERESLFHWIEHIDSLQAYFYSIKEKNIELTDIESAKQYRLAALVDDYSYHFLLSKGFVIGENLSPVQSRTKLLSMLVRRSEIIDLVMMSDSLLEQQFTDIDIPAKIKKHDEIAPLTLDFYLACSLQTSRELVTKLQNSKIVNH